MVNLHRRQIVPSVSCALCNVLPEDSLHAVWYCEAISGAWSTLDWFHQTAPPRPTSFTELLSSFLYNKEEFRAEIFVIMVWLLWNRRNAVQFGHPPLPVASICSSAGSYLQEFLQAQNVVPESPRPPPMQQWRPPDPQCFKVNFDAALFQRSNLAGIGIIARNHVGEAVGALSSPIPMAQSVADIEALACLKAVQFALEIGLNRVVIEGDSAVIINALLHGAGELASFGNILDDIRLHSSVFPFVEFVHVSRICNSVADALAKKAKSNVGDQIWLNDLPSDIAPLVLHDVH
ncbi:uncharacterized protein LOC126699161 [Quercus robur]|uniref:uncharacterized protein LOC126699161 n=1 Tax=Quercus robur TaxID=38942 RepID=UPI002162E251|nr:uncharacterized protein LOC126699161 [Quercus robur]